MPTLEGQMSKNLRIAMSPRLMEIALTGFGQLEMVQNIRQAHVPSGCQYLQCYRQHFFLFNGAEFWRTVES